MSRPSRVVASLDFPRREMSPSTVFASWMPRSTMNAPLRSGVGAAVSSTMAKHASLAESWRSTCMAVWATMGSASPSSGASAAALMFAGMAGAGSGVPPSAQTPVRPCKRAKAITASLRVRASSLFSAFCTAASELTEVLAVSKSASSRSAHGAMLASAARAVSASTDFAPSPCRSAQTAATRVAMGVFASFARA